MTDKIKIGIVGIGNCCSSLVQGIEHYKKKNEENCIGLMHWDIGGYKPYDIEPVIAFDVDERKVGIPLNRAIFQSPNCTELICDDVNDMFLSKIDYPVVKMGKVLDGVSCHMDQYDMSHRFIVSTMEEPTKEEVVKDLKESGAEILINYLPVGSQKATEFYAECALEAGVAFINCIPVFIASNPDWERKFREKGLPIIGDDVKSQLGATIVHRALADLFRKRGVKLDRTYQLNIGGNADFANMTNRERLKSKKVSKTEAVQSVLDKRLDDENIHIGPSDYVSQLKDNKIAYIRMDGRIFGDMPINLELRLSVEDSPNSAGVVIDAIRCTKLALGKKIGGVLYAPSSYFMKHPPKQVPDDVAYDATEDFIYGAQKI